VGSSHVSPGLPAPWLKYVQPVPAAPTQSGDLVRRRRVMMGARSRLLPLQIKPIVRPALDQRDPVGQASSAMECNK